MAKLSKKRQAAEEKIDRENYYSMKDAMELVKEVNTASFDASVDLHVNLGVDPRQADQAVRGTTVLPHGTGKDKSVLVLCSPDKVEEAINAGADYAGLDEYVEKIQGGWVDFDVVIAQPTVMAQVGKLGRVLGPRGLMPNPKSGTVTMDIGSAVEEVKKGKIAFRVDKYGIIHSPVGRVSFSVEKLAENAREFLNTIMNLKPASSKGIYMKAITVASTMSPGIKIDPKNFRIID